MHCTFEDWARRLSVWCSHCLFVALIAALNVSDAQAAAPNAVQPVLGATVVQQPLASGDLPFKRDEAGEVGTGTAVATAICLLVLAVWVAVQYRTKHGQGSKRMPLLFRWPAIPPRGERSLRVLESTPLTSHVRLHIVNWRGKEYLVSTTADGVQVLDQAEGGGQAEALKSAPRGRNRGHK